MSARPPRIYGLETEYALIYEPSDRDTRAVDARTIHGHIETLLRERHRTLPAEGRKGGIFLENGALVTFEALTLRQGLIEISTPECTSPRQVVVFQAALDQLLLDLLPPLHERLSALGCRGRVIIGKNSTDHRKNYYGAHENYSIDLPWRGSGAALMLGLCGFEVLFLLLEITLYGLCFLCLPLLLALLVVVSPLALLGARPLDRCLELGARAWLVARKRVVSPIALLYSRFLEATLLAPVLRHLSAYFVTRPVFCGSGGFRTRGDAPAELTLMQRADHVQDYAAIFGARALFDLKAGCRDPFWALGSSKRLHVVYSDSNIAETALFLKMGVTGILLDMLEAGQGFEDLALARPREAVVTVSRDPDLRVALELEDGRRLRAIDVQRAYLARARAFYETPSRRCPEVEEILDAWADVLDRLDRCPESLAGRVDWITKRQLMRPILEASPELARLPRVFSEAPRIVSGLRARGIALHAAEDVLTETLAEILGPRALARLLARLEAREVPLGRFVVVCHRALQARKLDLKYHELSPEGYGVRLFRAGTIATVSSGHEVALACTDPPPGTRASLRASLIRAAAPLPGAPCPRGRQRLGWSTWRDDSGRVRLTFPDPFTTSVAASRPTGRGVSPQAPTGR